jgi:hypothetical protein
MMSSQHFFLVSTGLLQNSLGPRRRMQTYWRDAAKVKADGQGVPNGGGILHLVILVAIREMRDPNERNESRTKSFTVCVRHVYMRYYTLIRTQVYLCFFW